MKGASKVKPRVIETVSRLFYEQGFHATGINQIIENSSVAKASLYQHFSSKDDLLDAYLQHISEQWHKDFEAFSANQTTGENKILALFDFRRQLAVKNQFKGCAFIRVAYELPDLNEQAREKIQNHKNYIKNFIKENIMRLSNPPPQQQVDELLELLLYLYEGCGIQSTVLRSAQPIEEAKKIAQKLLR